MDRQKRDSLVALLLILRTLYTKTSGKTKSTYKFSTQKAQLKIPILNACSIHSLFFLNTLHLFYLSILKDSDLTKAVLEEFYFKVATRQKLVRKNFPRASKTFGCRFCLLFNINLYGSSVVSAGVNDVSESVYRSIYLSIYPSSLSIARLNSCFIINANMSLENVLTASNGACHVYQQASTKDSGATLTLTTTTYEYTKLQGAGNCSYY